MPRKIEIPDKPRFNFASRRAYELLIELNINKFPVEPREIIEYFNNWFLAGYLELKQEFNEEDPLSLREEQAEAKTVKLRNTDEYLIVYDEEIDSEARIRWTLAHEIGHIVLGHLDHFEATALNRRGLSKEEYSVLEVEAHWFAAELLSPKPIMKLFNLGDTSEIISLICDISKEAATKRFKQLKNKGYHNIKIENKLLRNFYHHISNKGYLNAMFSTAARYQGSRIYPELCKFCRVCNRCNAFIEGKDQKYCQICGSSVPDIYNYSPFKSSRDSFQAGYNLMLKGKLYKSVETNENFHILFCPICKNHKFSNTAEYCEVCDTPLFNICIKENKVLDASYRYCPDCGSETEYTELYDYLPSKVTLESFEYLPIDLEDYIEYEYWDFIKMSICHLVKDMDLFTALAESSAFRDGTNFVILVSNKMDLAIVNRGLSVISNSLHKYGDAIIKNIRCYSVI